MSCLIAACSKKAATASGSGPGSAAATSSNPAPAKAAGSDGYVLVRGARLLPREGFKFVTHVIDVSKGTFSIKNEGGESSQPFTEEVDQHESLEALSATRARYLLEDRVRKRGYSGREASEMLSDRVPLKGKPLLVDGDDETGIYSIARESEADRTVDVKTLLEVERLFNNNSSFAIYGSGKPRKPGDHWDVHRLDLRDFCGLKDPVGTFSVEFLRIEELEGTPCAVLKFSFDLTAESATYTYFWKEQKIALKGESTCYRSLADQVDLDLRTMGTRTIQGSRTAGRQPSLFKTFRDSPKEEVVEETREESTFTYRQLTRIEKR